MSYYEAFMWLLIAHWIGDWALQPNWIGQNKGKYKEVMFSHCMIYTGCIIIALAYIGVDNLVGWFFLLLISHYGIDYWKCKATKEFPTWHLYIDHILHIGILLGILIFQRNDFLSL